MIYAVNGLPLPNAYRKNGAELSQAYNVEGNQVYHRSSGIPDYSNYSFTQKWASKGVGNTQGYDIFNNKVFWISKSGNSSEDNKMYIYDLSDGSAVLNPAYITGYGGHGNNVTFSRQRYEAGDTYPLMLISSAYANPCYLVRLTDEYQASIVRRYTIPLIDQVTNGGYDITYGETDDIAYVASVFGSNSSAAQGTHICIAQFDMSDLTENEDGTFSPAFIKSVRCDWHYWKQGIKYHDGLIWLASGYPGFNADVYGIDPETGETKYHVNCETTTEIEGAVWYPDAEVVGGYALYVGFQGMMMRKYTFGELV